MYKNVKKGRTYCPVLPFFIMGQRRSQKKLPADADPQAQNWKGEKRRLSSIIFPCKNRAKTR
jgi:hypothetical protein